MGGHVTTPPVRKALYIQVFLKKTGGLGTKLGFLLFPTEDGAVATGGIGTCEIH